MTFNPDDGELLPDGSRIQETTAGELADWLAEHPPVGCGCEDPQPYNLCCPSRLIYPAYTEVARKGTSRYRKDRARAYMAKFGIRYTRALRLVGAEMEAPGFNPRQPIPEELPDE